MNVNVMHLMMEVWGEDTNRLDKGKEEGQAQLQFGA